VAQLLEGAKFDLASEKGKNVVVLDFWATWCGPCRAAMPIVSEVVASYKGKGVVGYAVNLAEDVEKLKEFKKVMPALTLPILLDTDSKIAEAYRVQPIPMTVMVDKNGIVQVVHLGIPRDLEVLRKMLTSEIDTLLAGGTVPDEKKPEAPKPPEKKSEKGDEDHEKPAAK
jgi:thiol-disulfide isomerase/thioredoxin